MKIGPFEISLRTRSRTLGTQNGWSNLPDTGLTAAGITVTGDSPIGHATVFSCINVIAEGCAMLPLVPWRRVDGGRVRATDHPLDRLLSLAPCPHMSAFNYWKLVLFDKLHRGNHYSLVIRRDGAVAELYPLPCEDVRPFWYADEVGMPRRAYQVAVPGRRVSAVFLEDEILHVQNLPILRGVRRALMGASVWEHYQAETIGGALATEEFGNRHFANGASLSGMISVDGSLSAEQARETRELVMEAYAGVNNAGKIGVFGGGAKFTPMSQDAEKAQLLDTRKYNRSVIAGILRVSAHLINDLEKATFSNIEHLDIGHYKHCLLPHLRDLRQTVTKDVLTAAEQSAIELDHDTTELLRGDQKSFAEVLEKAVQNARMTPNEARAQTNLPPMEGGDRLYINAASVPLDKAGKDKDGADEDDAAAQ